MTTVQLSGAELCSLLHGPLMLAGVNGTVGAFAVDGDGGSSDDEIVLLRLRGRCRRLFRVAGAATAWTTPDAPLEDCCCGALVGDACSGTSTADVVVAVGLAGTIECCLGGGRAL